MGEGNRNQRGKPSTRDEVGFHAAWRQLRAPLACGPSGLRQVPRDDLVPRAGQGARDRGLGQEAAFSWWWWWGVLLQGAQISLQ